MTQNGDGPGDEIDSKNKMVEQDCLPARYELIQWLAINKLHCYHQSFIEKGYDDLEEIIQMSDDLLTQLANDVGMIEKPNHVRRLKGGVARMKAETICPAGLFQFGAANATAVTTATPQASSQTFGLSSTPVSSSSQTVKPFAFNAGSTSQGFSFAPAQPSGTAGGLQSTFNFGASAPKPEATFAAFAPAQPSSSQQTPFMFGASSSNPTPTPTPEETMEVDGNNSSGNLFAPPANPTGNAFGSTGPNSGGFAFGAPTAPSATGFNFGAAAQASTGPSTFAFEAGAGGAPTFGASTAPTGGAAPAPGGFNFSAAAANNNNAGPGVFNFGGGAVTPSGGSLFTAGAAGDPSNPAIAQRKFKKVVRRPTKR